MIINFAVQAYQSRSLPLAAQQCINLYAEQQPADAKSQVAIFNTPGLDLIVDTGGSAGRGAHVMAGIFYAVIGNTLYSIDQHGNSIDLGDIKGTGRVSIAGTGRVSMADNAVQLCIVNGAEGYIYTAADGLVQITDEDFLPADTVVYQDGYFIFSAVGTGQFFISNLLDGTSYLATDFADAEGQSDNLVAVFSNHREVFLFGKKTTEVWYNSGNLDFPFSRIGGAFIERGCAAAHSIARIDNTLIFLGEDRIVYRMQGYVPQRISQHAIEHTMEAYTTVSDAFAFSYTMAGHKFYVLTFPTEKDTWVYDASTSLWHQRQSFGLSRWRVNGYAEAYGKHMVIDSEGGIVGDMNPDAYVEYGNTMQGIAAAAPIHSGRKRLFMRRLELDIESGVGLTSGQGSDPQIMLDWSDDGGRTFSARQLWRSMGKIGEYRQRLRWNRMGSFRNRILRAIIADPIKRTGIAAHADLDTGTS